MIGAEILQNLFKSRDELSDMIIELQPHNDEERKQLQDLMKRRDGITGAINQIIAKKFDEATQGLAEKSLELADLTVRLTQLNKTISNVNAAIQIADEIIQVTSSILTLAATL